ncbi:MAG: class II fructose-bisphosphate aldolase, partial [bacterium]
MGLVTMREMLQDADKRKYAVGAFNANNMEIV